MDGQVVIAPSEFAGDFSVLETALSGSLERRGAELVADLRVDTSGPMQRHIGAAIHRAPAGGTPSSIDDLYREFEASSPRLGSRVEAEQGAGIIVALDRDRGVAVIELDSGETVEVDASQ